MGVKRWLAIAGSIAFAFASYNIIILVAGHITKAYVIAYMPLTIAGILLLFKRKWLWGAVTLTVGIALSLKNGHIQITYYLAIFCIFLVIGLMIKEIRDKKYADILKIVGTALGCMVLAVLPNIGNLYSNYELAQESMRGPSDLTQAAEPAEKVSSGLDKDYAFMWSYGRGELLTLIIPNAYGGETGGVLDQHSALYKAMRAQGHQPQEKEIRAATYWGDQEGTSGPVYFGALVCFLFLLGMFVIKNPIKWWMAGAALFFILLSLGRSLDWFNEFIFYHLPMYNKFRVPSMALVIPGMIFPIIGIWGLKEILTGKTESAFLKKALIWSLSVVGGLCLIVWLMPSIFLSFQSAADAGYQMPDWYYNALLEDRKSLATSDAFRSLVYILLGGGLLFFYLKSKNKKQPALIAGIGITVLLLADLWTVDKRYLNNDSFKKEKLVESYQKSPADDAILRDTHPSYRVLNLNNPFQETGTSFFHKSIGGYHAVKLRRYQELIDHRLAGEITGKIITSLQNATTVNDLMSYLEECYSLNMLNAKYIIYNPEHPPILNPYAYGNAWFVNEFKIVQNADEEIASLNEIKPLQTAVVDQQFADNLAGLSIRSDSAASIVLTSYKPNELVYKSKAATEQLAVFSEVYYEHGWKAYIDGELTPHFRTDWILRGMKVPAGEHTIEFKFIPDTYNQLVMIGSVGSGIIVLLLLAALILFFWDSYKKKTLLPKN